MQSVSTHQGMVQQSTYWASSGFHDSTVRSWVGGCGDIPTESRECNLWSGGGARIAEGNPNVKCAMYLPWT